VVWTVVPILILIAIAIPSFRLLYFQRDLPVADMTIKAIGNKWYWDYEYPDHGDISFTATMKADEDLKDGEPRLLQTDVEVVVPVNKVIRVIVTANDVLHAWTVPSFGSKIDAVPGRLNETWFKAKRKACSTASARNCAARTMRSCRLPSGWCPRSCSIPGPRRPRTMSTRHRKQLSAALSARASWRSVHRPSRTTTTDLIAK
jgi:hypothetical protein